MPKDSLRILSTSTRSFCPAQVVAVRLISDVHLPVLKWPYDDGLELVAFEANAVRPRRKLLLGVPVAVPNEGLSRGRDSRWVDADLLELRLVVHHQHGVSNKKSGWCRLSMIVSASLLCCLKV